MIQFKKHHQKGVGMRFLSASSLAVGLILAVGLLRVHAQEGLRGSGGYIGGFNMIAIPAIQKELQLDDNQVAKVKAVAERMTDRFQQDMSKLKGLNGEEKAKRRITLSDPHYEEGMKQLRSILKPAQLDRFDQILFQQRGPMAMLEPKIAQILQINNEQAQKVAELVARTQNEQKSAVEAAGKGTKAAAVKIESIAAEANEQAITLLSPEQKRTWARLVGRPFRPDLGGPAQPTEHPAKP